MLANYFKIGLDMGNSTMKMVTYEDSKPKCYIIKSLATTDASDDNAVVKLKGSKETVYLGVGNPLVAIDKTSRKYIKECILLAVDKLLGEGIKENDFVTIGVGLPLGDFKNESKKKHFEEEMKKINYLEGTVNGSNYAVRIDVQVFSEGIAAFFAYSPEISKKERWVIWDCGYGTSDIIGISYDSYNKCWKIDNYLPINKGLMHIYQAISKAYSDDTGLVRIEPENVEFYLKDKESYIDQTLTGLSKYIYAAKDEIDSLYQAIANHFTDLPLRKLYLLGGNTPLLYYHLKDHSEVYYNNYPIRNLLANATGYFLQAN